MLGVSEGVFKPVSIMPRALALALLGLHLAVAGCATSRPTIPDVYAEAKDPYLLGTGDRLRVIVYGQDGLSNVYGIDTTGRVSLPLLGPVQAAGLTLRDLEKRLEERLRAGYLREPKVSVEIDTYRPFFILGEVQSPGQFPYVPGMTIETAVAIAGGFTPRAFQQRAELTRMIDGQSVTGAVPTRYPIKPGDTIKIPERWF